MFRWTLPIVAAPTMGASSPCHMFAKLGVSLTTMEKCEEVAKSRPVLLPLPPQNSDAIPDQPSFANMWHPPGPGQALDSEKRPVLVKSHVVVFF